MVLHHQTIKPIPSLTKEIAQKAFPKGNLYMTLRDELETIYDDDDFAELYSSEGQPALRPGNLALVCVMQYMANLSDRGAVEALAARNFVLVNECQDLNLCQIELSRKLVGKDGRLLYVGDPKQAIFGFAGAKCNSYDSRFA
ncbi:hypothetical protein H1P_1300001 [Hyella patelloides LEGE 07179]|uniref:Uncharacterized protein n=1 Tax=Hyella patelloides LEGE 07179 TaxID=945734 RepID=A0A563VKU7_9CYAN|nr:UvrD-helicase domain-containing protein [Hyella patelloides]VEP12041.1 hypothetical protein H1P_1300001 [Hyella patelloides LEGE 07179]